MFRQNLQRPRRSRLPLDPTRLLQDPQLARLSRRALDDTERWHQRRRKLDAPSVLSFALALPLFRTRSQEDILSMFFGDAETSDAPTPEAMVHARARLGWEPLERLFELQAETVRPAPSLGKLRAWGVDGVKFTVPDTRENARAFGRGGNRRGSAAYPQVTATCLVDLQSHGVREVCIGPYSASERDGVALALRHLGHDDLLVLDQGLPSAELLETIQEAGVGFLARIPSRWKPRYLQKLGRGEWLAQLEGTAEIPPKKRTPGGRKTRSIRLQVRVVEYKVGRNKRIRLVTNLTRSQARAKKLARLYRERWECELAFKELKSHLAVLLSARAQTVFRSKTPAGVLQEIYALYVVYNAIRGLMQKAVEETGTSPLHLSFRRIVVFLQDRIIIALGCHTGPLLESIRARRNKRPRRPRAYSRVVKRKMSNFPKKRPGHRQRRVAWSSKLRLMHRRSRSGKAA